MHHDAAAQIVARAQAEDVDGLLVLGDNVYPTGAASANDPAFATLYEQPFAALTATHSFYVVLGNHDVLTSNGQPELDYATTHPYWVQPARYYERHLERTCLLGLDTNQADVDATQLAAVSSGCANDVTLLHRVAFGHHPVYSSGTHGLNNDEPWMDAQVRPALEQLGVNFYLSGHDHDFEAIVPQASGINYIISGGASQLRPIAASAQSLHAFSDYHFGKLELYTRYADLTVYGEDGSVRWTHRYDLPTS
ncbi:MAG: metallophosphoesterase [Candidatus Andersenbacteria bacterium]